MPPQTLDHLVRHFAYANLMKEHASADSATGTADQSARNLARQLIGPDASEAKELEIAGLLIDLLTYLTNLSDDMTQKNVPDDDWKPIVTAFVGQCVKAIERALP
jgi:hypothetical protein